MSRNRRCVLLFARTPRQEALAKGLGRDTALFEFTRDRVRAASAALDGVDLFVPIQGPGSFGEKLAGAFAQARAEGYERIVAVPIDAPGLGARELAGAFAALETHDIVLGPSPDGGVYLLGLRGESAVPARLADVRWLTSRVASDLMALFPGAAVLDRVVADLDRRADLAGIARDAVDDPELAALVSSLQGGRTSGTPGTTFHQKIGPAARRWGRAPPALPARV